MAAGDVNWCTVLAHHAEPAPDKVMTIFEGAATTYREMAGRVAATAAGLAERGVGRGDVVAILSYNCPEFLEALFAANALGAIAMPINWRLAAPEVRYILEHSGARALVCDASLLPLADEATVGLGDTPVRVSISPVDDSAWTFLGDLRGTSTRVPRAAAAADDVHRLMYTSGTTGRPKGVMLTHANLAWKNLAHIVEFGFTECRSRSGLRSALPCRRARPDDDVTDCCGCHDHCASFVRGVRRGRRNRALPASPPSGWRPPWSTRSWPCPISNSAISRPSGWSSTGARRCRSPSLSAFSVSSPRHGSPMPTA